MISTCAWVNLRVCVLSGHQVEPNGVVPRVDATNVCHVTIVILRGLSQDGLFDESSIRASVRLCVDCVDLLTGLVIVLTSPLQHFDD